MLVAAAGIIKTGPSERKGDVGTGHITISRDRLHTNVSSVVEF